MDQISTKGISEELTKREGITQITVEPYELVRIITGQEEREFIGPAIIIINQD